ncbi:MAG: Fic family protein [Proteobacteria bacterium]|nr:Fic family protein [Pseudomonadota bacterium]
MISIKIDQKKEKALNHLHGLFVEAWTSLQDVSPSELDYLHRFAFISTIGASTRIENALLTDHEIEWIDTTLKEDSQATSFEAKKEFIVDKLLKDRERSLEEVAGCREVLGSVYTQYKDLFPLTEASIRGLHHDLLRYYPAAGGYAGSYKKSPNRVISINHSTKEERVVLEPASPGIITETAMSDLVGWYNETLREHPRPLLVAIEFVFRFLAIHPFQDGNGRLGRALFLLALLQSDDKYLAGITPYLAIDRHIEKNRANYYSVLHRTSEGKFFPHPGNYDFVPLVEFFLKVFEDSLSDIDLYRKRYADMLELSASAATVFEAFRNNPKERLQVAELVQNTSLPRRTIQYVLKTLTEKGFLQRLGKGAGSRYQLAF